MAKRYVIDYCSGPTGYGWRQETDSILDVLDIIRSESYGKCYTASVNVWDREKKTDIFWKRTLDAKPEIDFDPDMEYYKLKPEFYDYWDGWYMGCNASDIETTLGEIIRTAEDFDLTPEEYLAMHCPLKVNTD